MFKRLAEQVELLVPSATVHIHVMVAPFDGIPVVHCAPSYAPTLIKYVFAAGPQVPQGWLVIGVPVQGELAAVAVLV
jgi:hypothetical protein